jgi:hypothetical protein
MQQMKRQLYRIGGGACFNAPLFRLRKRCVIGAMFIGYASSV